MKTQRILFSTLLVAILLGAILYARMDASQDVFAGANSVDEAPGHSKMPTTSLKIPTLAVPAASDASESPVARSSDWKQKWSAIPLDQSGRSFGPRQTTPFNRALTAEVRDDLHACTSQIPRTTQQSINIELFVEAHGSGYDIIGAEAASDAGFDSYARRCMELAFEKRLEIPDAGTVRGMLYHVSFPIVLLGTSDDDAGVPL